MHKLHAALNAQLDPLRPGLRIGHALKDREEYWRLMREQDGKCAICGGEEVHKRNKRLSIDHDHETGKVRGLLCSHCNSGLGMFRDDPELMGAARAYLNGI